MTMVGPDEESKKKLAYMPQKEATDPMIIDRNTTLEKLFDNIRAEMAGPTITDASNVTPIEDIETIIMVARTNEKSSSICEVLSACGGKKRRRLKVLLPKQ
jgi:hypothetical protein